jgi:predicted nucleotidyltransferase
MLKIYELLLSKELILEDLIKKSSVGRTSGFEAIKWMEEKGFVKIKNLGRQKQISLNKDRYTLQFKSFIDSLKFKELNKNFKYPINLFIDNLKNNDIKCILLFGSVLYEKNPKDIDILIVYSNKINKDNIIKVRDNIELLTNFIINLHFDNNPSDEKLLNSVCLFGFDYYINLLTKGNRINIQFSEAISWYTSSYINIKNKELFNDCFDNIIVNLSFVYSLMNNITPKTKNEAKKIFFGHYGKLNKLGNFDNYKKMEIIKEVLAEIGKELYK